MPYLLGAPFPPLGVPPLFDVDFTAFSLGARSAATFLSETATGNPGGLTFARNSVITCQTSASTVDSSAAVDDACIGCTTSLQADRGLVMQPRTASLVQTHPRRVTGWSNGEPNGNAGYSGTSAAQNNNSSVACADGQTLGVHVQTYVGTRGGPAYSPTQVDGNYGMFTSSPNGLGGAPDSHGYTLSGWYNDATQMAVQNGGNPSPPTSVGSGVAVKDTSTGWHRVTLQDTVAYIFWIVTDSRSYVDFGGGGIQAYDVVADFLSATRGEYPLEAFQTASEVNAIHYLSYATGSDFVSTTSQIKMRLTLTPMHASTERVYYDTGAAHVSTGWALWSYQTSGPVNSYAYVRQSDKKLVVKVGSMTEIVSSNALSWARGDEVELYVAVGGNVASVAKYRVNGGSWTDLVLATVANTPAPTGAIYLMSAPFDGTGGSNDRFSWAARCHRITVFGEGAPEGV